MKLVNRIAKATRFTGILAVSVGLGIIYRPLGIIAAGLGLAANGVMLGAVNEVLSQDKFQDDIAKIIKREAAGG